MSDRFLFKGKRINWKDLPKEKWWVEGDVSLHKTGKVFIKKRFGDALASVEIIPETLSQYVGHCDIHGNKIWENDILKEKFNLDLEYEKWEVIGNVFDNPEYGFCLDTEEEIEKER